MLIKKIFKVMLKLTAAFFKACIHILMSRSSFATRNSFSDVVQTSKYYNKENERNFFSIK